MSSHDAPQRVFALKNADDTTVYSYGVGTYVGDLPCPQKVQMFGGEEELRERIRRIIEQADQLPVERSILVELFDSLGPGDTLTTREEAIAAQEAERARPLDDRIQDSMNSLVTNPCIHLDSGDTVWGMQCWWGPEDRMDEKIQGRRVEIVPVPEGNERWESQ